jgi:hypothetical protein
MVENLEFNNVPGTLSIADRSAAYIFRSGVGAKLTAFS